MLRIPLIFILALSSFLISGCDKPKSNPESFDPIYADLVKLKKEAETQLEVRKKDLENFEVEAKAAKPQTGQIKYAMKRVNETKADINRLIQLVDYYGIKSESRKKQAFKAYMKAFREKKEWPDPKEFEEYQVQKRFESATKVWSQKQQIEQQKAANLAAEKAEAAKSGGH